MFLEFVLLIASAGMMLVAHESRNLDLHGLFFFGLVCFVCAFLGIVCKGMEKRFR